MRTVTHREMRNSSGEILRAVAAGETVQVTNNGQVAAVISPPPSGSLDRLVAQGQARPARRDVADLSTISRRTPKRTSAELVEDARGRW
jgi:prevent-host-death family protein